MNRIGEMTEIYAAAVRFEADIEGNLLEAANTARKMSLEIQSSSTIRSQSATLFLQLSKKFRSF